MGLGGWVVTRKALLLWVLGHWAEWSFEVLVVTCLGAFLVEVVVEVVVG
jgi:hypothetical protein